MEKIEVSFREKGTNPPFPNKKCNTDRYKYGDLNDVWRYKYGDMNVHGKAIEKNQKKNERRC